MRVVRVIREGVVRGAGVVIGVVCGSLGALAVLVATIVPALLGLLAVVFVPLRAVVERLRRPHGEH
jgi:hypothetical protein